MQWVGTWSSTPAVAEGIAFRQQTLRLIAHVSLGGAMLRVRISNAYGTGKLTLGAASVGLREAGADIVPGSLRPLTFGGRRQATIAAGTLLVSDPVALTVKPFADLAVSLYLPSDISADFQVTGHFGAKQTNYISTPGDFTAAELLPVAETKEAWCFLSGIEIVAPIDAGGIVAFGDSLTDANLSTPDANNRWSDQLARRLHARTSGRRFGIMNQGLGGNRILHDQRGDSGLRRFDRDVLAQSGVTHAIVMLGTNDLRNWRARPEEEPSAEDLIAGLRQLALRAQSRRIRVFAATLLPFENESFVPGTYTPEKEAKRIAVNDWIRGGDSFDGVIDFDRALRDPDHPAAMLAVYDCGDHLHPSDRGYRAMGDAIDLSLFDEPA